MKELGYESREINSDMGGDRWLRLLFLCVKRNGGMFHQEIGKMW